MKKGNNIYFIIFVLSFIISLSFFTSPLYAQFTGAEIKENTQSSNPNLKEYTQQKQITADELMATLLKQAELNIQQRQRQQLLRTQVSASVNVGVESNPNNTSQGKGDQYSEEYLSMAWVPTFNNWLSARVSYSIDKQDYYKYLLLRNFDHTTNVSLKLSPLKSGALILEPGVGYDRLLFHYDPASDTSQFDSYFKFTHYLTEQWNYGGKYEYDNKKYYKTAAYDDNQNNRSFSRLDIRNNLELWLRRNINKYSIKLRSRFYTNDSNSTFQKYYDYWDYAWYVTFSGSFLKDDKLYLLFTPSFEKKNYLRRVADDGTVRADKILNWSFNAYYSLTKHTSLTYSLTWMNSTSNSATGRFLDVTNVFGVSADF